MLGTVSGLTDIVVNKLIRHDLCNLSKNLCFMTLENFYIAKMIFIVIFLDFILTHPQTTRPFFASKFWIHNPKDGYDFSLLLGLQSSFKKSVVEVT